MIAFHAMSWGLIISALTTEYRDLTQLIVSILFFALPRMLPKHTLRHKT